MTFITSIHIGTVILGLTGSTDVLKRENFHKSLNPLKFLHKRVYGLLYSMRVVGSHWEAVLLAVNLTLTVI